jgi:RNA polymerase sigma-70 factor, ECF subfamily
VFEEDRQLARQLANGDQRAFRAFFDSYVPVLAAFVMRRSKLDHASAEDVVQNVLIRALRAMPGYRGEASLLTWLCQICRSELADGRRKLGRRPTTVSMDSDPSAAAVVEQLRATGELELEREALSTDEATALRVLERLPERYACVLEWKYGDDMSVEQIARQMGISVTAAQSLLARARDAFRELWRTVPSGSGT